MYLTVYICYCLKVPLLLLLTQHLGREMVPLLPMLHAVVLRMNSWTVRLTSHMAVFMKMTWHSGVQLPVQVSHGDTHV